MVKQKRDSLLKEDGMKRIVLSLMLLVIMAFIMIGADIRKSAAPVAPVEITQKPSCIGYTVIEAGRGINCHGDTVELIRHNGFYELASRNNTLIKEVPSVIE